MVSQHVVLTSVLDIIFWTGTYQITPTLSHQTSRTHLGGC